MLKRFLTLMLTLTLVLSLSAPVMALERSTEYELTGYAVPLRYKEVSRVLYGANAPTEAEVYQAMIAMQSSYPEGMPWTNDNGYEWNGGIFSAGYGCAGFTFILSDAAFGALPARIYNNGDFTFEEARVGDILRINNDTHSVIVLEVQADGVVIAEGNFNSSIHWGRQLTAAEVMASDYIITRYPLGEGGPTAAPTCYHTYQMVETLPSTCAKPGYEKTTCVDCGEVLKEVEIPVTEHTYQMIETLPPTCAKPGYERTTCMDCGELLSEVEIPATGHSYQSLVTDPTETEQGYTTYVCTNCGDCYVDDYVPALTPVETPEEKPEETPVETPEEKPEETPEETPEQPWENPYADVKESAWYYEAVKFVSQNSIMNGMGDDGFCPNATTTRAMIWTMLARLDGVDTNGGAKWYEKGMAWAMENGITDGTNASGEITREQLAVMLYRYEQRKGGGFTGTWMFLLDYADREAVSDWAYEALCWMTMNGVMNGMDGKLCPENTATRAQVAKMLMEYLK